MLALILCLTRANPQNLNPPTATPMYGIAFSQSCSEAGGACTVRRSLQGIAFLISLYEVLPNPEQQQAKRHKQATDTCKAVAIRFIFRPRSRLPSRTCKASVPRTASRISSKLQLNLLWRCQARAPSCAALNVARLKLLALVLLQSSS